MNHSVFRQKSGSAGIELVIVTPVLLLLMLGLYDIGNAIQQDIWLEQAARAGGIFALTDPANTSAIGSAVQAAVGNPVTVNVTTSPACSDNSTPISNGATPPSYTCAGQAIFYQSITITAQATYKPLILPLSAPEAQYVESVP